MHSEYEMSLVGEVAYFLGFQVKQIKEGIFVSQSNYAKNIAKKFRFENARHKHTPAATHNKLTKDDKGVDVDQSIYRSIIGSLLYLTNSHPDIIFSLGVYSLYQANPKVIHLTQVKRIIKYVNGTYDYGILYSHDTNSILVGYYDASWAGNIEDRKSTSSGCFFQGNILIS